MRTRNSDTLKSATAQKKSPPSRKSAAKTQNQTATPADSPPHTHTPTPTPNPSIAATNTSSPFKAQPGKKSQEVVTPPVTDPNMEASAAGPKASSGDTDVTPQPTPSTRKVTRRVVRKKIVRRTPVSSKAALAQTPKPDENDNKKEDASQGETPRTPIPVTMDSESSQREEAVAVVRMQSGNQEEEIAPVAQQVEDISSVQDKGKAKVDEEELPDAYMKNNAETESDTTAQAQKPVENEDVAAAVVSKVQDDELIENLPGRKYEQQIGQKDQIDGESGENMEKDENRKKGGEDQPGDETVGYGEDESFIVPEEEDLRTDDDSLDNAEEGKASEAEHMELAEAAKVRKLRKELEVFVRGLDRDVVEDDLKKAFEKVGKVVEVKLLKDPSSSRNRGFSFVQFASKEQAKRALSEMKNPVIRGKRCSTLSSEDNDVLFVGNICNTWTKEAIKHKLREYGLEGVESITLVQDPRQEGLSRGFCFVQFACHADAMDAYKRLQKPDAIFGHAERTAKVAFAEPLREPDPDVMSKVKSVFVDGLPPHWDEDRVRENFKCYGEIERITLARNMSSAKRKDFGFVDFSTHEAAIACIKDVNTKELGEGNSKARVKARLSNPMPKTQAVKGGMCGGFRIGRGGAVGRGFGRNSRPFDRPNYQYQRGFYQHGRSQFVEPVSPYSDFHDGRSFGFGGRRASLRGAYQPPVGQSVSRSNFGGLRHGVPSSRDIGRPASNIRQPFVPEDEGYPPPYMGRHVDDQYIYDDRTSGMKRPFYMTDPDPGYFGPSRVRPRFEYSDPTHGNRYRDTYGPGPGAGVGPGPGAELGAGAEAGHSMYSSGYYGPDLQHGAGPYPSFHGGNHTFGGGYYY